MRNRPDTKRIPNEVIGLGLIVLCLVGGFLALTKRIPWDHGYQVKALFSSAQNIRPHAQVRIAGIKVGEVTGVRRVIPDSPDAVPVAEVTMRIDDAGRPLHADATMKLRPRLFLEGNLFVDVTPGTPSSPEVANGHEYPLTQTATSVQLDQVLTTLQAPVRSDLQVLLREFGSALADNGGAAGLHQFYASSGAAFKPTAVVAEALQGTAPGDLSGTVNGLDRIFRGLGRNEAQLRDLVTNFSVVAGALASHDDALRRGIGALPGVIQSGRPALAALNAALPQTRALAREITPGLRKASPAIRHATPFMHQVRGLVSQPELRGLISDARPVVPDLAALSAGADRLLTGVGALGGCFNNVVIPWANDKVSADASYPFPANAPVYKQTGYGLSGVAGESRSGDANGQYVRAFVGTGTNAVASQPALAGAAEQFGTLAAPILGSVPAINSSAKTPYRPDVPCETQQPPDLNAGGVGPAPTQTPLSTASAADLPGALGSNVRDLRSALDLGAATGAAGSGAAPRAVRKVLQATLLDYLKRDWPRLAKQIRAEGTP
jgi:virulence factor Mce-like protein